MNRTIPTVSAAPSSTRQTREVAVLTQKVDVLTTMIEDLQAKQASQAAAAANTTSTPLDARIGTNELMVVSHNISITYFIVS